MSNNITGFKIDLSGHAILTYVGANGLRETFDLTAHIDERQLQLVQTRSQAEVEVHERKFHGHQL